MHILMEKNRMSPSPKTYYKFHAWTRFRSQGIFKEPLITDISFYI